MKSHANKDQRWSAGPSSQDPDLGGEAEMPEALCTACGTITSAELLQCPNCQGITEPVSWRRSAVRPVATPPAGAPPRPPVEPAPFAATTAAPAPSPDRSAHAFLAAEPTTYGRPAARVDVAPPQHYTSSRPDIDPMLVRFDPIESAFTDAPAVVDGAKPDDAFISPYSGQPVRDTTPSAPYADSWHGEPLGAEAAPESAFADEPSQPWSDQGYRNEAFSASSALRPSRSACA